MLASQGDLLTILLSAPEKPPRTTVRRRPRPPKAQPAAYVAPASKSRKTKCSCGDCSVCVDNEKWDRIFREKFADPDYYSRRHVPYASPLALL